MKAGIVHFTRDREFFDLINGLYCNSMKYQGLEMFVGPIAQLRDFE